MKEHLYSGLLDEETIGNLVDDFEIFNEDDTLLLLEMLPFRWMEEEEREEALLFTRYEGSLELKKYQKGRVFNPRGELYFERVDTGYRVIYAGLLLESRELLAAYPNEIEICGPKAYYLWGKKLQDKHLEKMGLQKGLSPPLYMEIMIPRVFSYPVDDTSRRCKLSIMEYVDREDGRTQYFRFHHLEGVEE